MRVNMLVCASIITQPIESQGNKRFISINMLGNYAGFAQSVVAIVDFFARQALAGSRHAGLVSAWLRQFREGDAPDPFSARREVQGRLGRSVLLTGTEGEAMSPERREESAVG